MITSLFFAAELLLVQQSIIDQVEIVPRQNAVLVVYDKTPAGVSQQVSVSTPITEPGDRPVSLEELRGMVAKTQMVVANPVMSFVVDQTIGAIAKEKYADQGEGGIAGASVPFDLRFVVTLGSVVPPTQIVAFTAAVADIERYIEAHIQSVNVTVTLRLVYVPLTAGRLGVTTARYSVEKYSDISNGFDRAVLNEFELCPVPLGATIPIRYSGVSTMATPENRVFVTRPLKLALGLLDPMGPSTPLDDGTITMSSAIQWDWDPSNGLQFGPSLLYSFQDHLLREVVQAMGFVAGADFLVRDCTVMDLFRFQQDVIDSTYLVTSTTNVFSSNPPVTCTTFGTAYEAGLVSGQSILDALDYNPGLNKTLIAKGAAISPAITATMMLAAVTAAVGDTPDPIDFLHNQIAGTVSGNTNAFNDSQILPALPTSQLTRGYPDGAVQTIVTVGTGGGARCCIVDFRGKVPGVSGPPVVAQFNNEFRGAMPRTVARNSVANKSILNFFYNTDATDFDFEMEMYDGSPVRGAFVKQNQLGSIGSRCLMGQSIGKGVTFFSRDYCSYSTTPNALDPLGNIADFLTMREWLVLDAMGWNIDMAALDTTDEGDANVTLTCP